jgi:hypothetical protein
MPVKHHIFRFPEQLPSDIDYIGLYQDFEVSKELSNAFI